MPNELREWIVWIVLAGVAVLLLIEVTWDSIDEDPDQVAGIQPPGSLSRESEAVDQAIDDPGPARSPWWRAPRC